MLVLIIIFMITAPMLNVGVPVDLPKTKAAALEDAKKSPVIISIDKDAKIYIEEANITLEELIQKLPIILENGKSDTIYVRGDKDLQYGKIMEIMGIISSADACKVSLIAEADTTTTSSRKQKNSTKQQVNNFAPQTPKTTTNKKARKRR
jgi:biopolymer transport protein TolR